MLPPSPWEYHMWLLFKYQISKTCSTNTSALMCVLNVTLVWSPSWRHSFWISLNHNGPFSQTPNQNSDQIWSPPIPMWHISKTDRLELGRPKSVSIGGTFQMLCTSCSKDGLILRKHFVLLVDLSKCFNQHKPPTVPWVILFLSMEIRMVVRAGFPVQTEMFPHACLLDRFD